MAENTENWTKLESDSRYPRKYQFEELQVEVAGVVSGFQGTIEIADTPTDDGYYNPIEEGTYTLAGGLTYLPTTTDKGYKVTFIKSGATWFKDRQDVGIDIDSYYTKEEIIVRDSLLNDVLLNATSTNVNYIDGVISSFEHKRMGVLLRTDSYTFGTNQVIESRELVTGEKLVITTNTDTLLTDIQYYGI